MYSGLLLQVAISYADFTAFPPLSFDFETALPLIYLGFDREPIYDYGGVDMFVMIPANEYE
jgi:hypothetical protein